MRYLLLFSIIFTFFIQYSFAAINYAVTPIKYELELNPGESITLPASIRNNGPDTVTLPTTASDFQVNGTSWTPSIVRKSELVYPDQELSTWITLWAPSVTLNPGEEWTIDFTIDVPTTATPGWHYWAVLFINAGSETSTSWNIGINVDYGIIILVNVSWEIVVDIDIEDPIISNSSKGGGNYKWSGDQWLFDAGIYSFTPNNGAWYVWSNNTGQAVYQNMDNCPLWDFTTSRYDLKCFWSSEPTLFWDDESPLKNNDSNLIQNTLTDDPLLFSDDFNIDFKFPINNSWNTHVKPVGKVVLKNENWEIIKAIWKESISNDRGAIIWENIVDYIPINDQDGNVLPYSTRIFESEWKGFPYKTYDDEWNQVVNYWTPSEYYTQKNKDESWFLMFWERVSEVRQDETITAEIDITYNDEEWNPIEFTSAQEFNIQYIEERVTINPYIVLGLLLLSTAGIFLYFGIRWWFLIAKISRCWNCKESIKSHWKTCPYCKTIQNKKQHKKYKKQSWAKQKKK